MKTAARLAALERKCRQEGLTPDEKREANNLRRVLRQHEALRRRYRDDPEYRAHKLGYRDRRTMEAAE